MWKSDCKNTLNLVTAVNSQLLTLQSSRVTPAQGNRTLMYTTRINYHAINYWPISFRLAITAIGLMAVAVFLTYGLQMYAPLEIIWNRLKNKISIKYHNISQIVLRTLCVILTGKYNLFKYIITSTRINEIHTISKILMG